MMKKAGLGIVAALALAMGLAEPGLAQTLEAKQATIDKVKGEVLARLQAGAWQIAQRGMILNEKDEIKTGEGAEAEVLLDRGKVARVEIREKSFFRLHTLKQDAGTGDRTTLLDLAIGKVLIRAEKLKGNSKFEVRTPTATTGVRGTVFEVAVELKQTKTSTT